MTVTGTAMEMFSLNDAQVTAIPSISVLIHDCCELKAIEKPKEYNGNRLRVFHR